MFVRAIPFENPAGYIKYAVGVLKIFFWMGGFEKVLGSAKKINICGRWSEFFFHSAP